MSATNEWRTAAAVAAWVDAADPKVAAEVSMPRLAPSHNLTVSVGSSQVWVAADVSFFGVGQSASQAVPLNSQRSIRREDVTAILLCTPPGCMQSNAKGFAAAPD